MSGEVPDYRLENALLKLGMFASAAVGIFVAGVRFDQWLLSISYSWVPQPKATIDLVLIYAGVAAFLVFAITSSMLAMRWLGQMRRRRRSQ
jgi:hypothetical protein